MKATLGEGGVTGGYSTRLPLGSSQPLPASIAPRAIALLVLSSSAPPAPHAPSSPPLASPRSSCESHALAPLYLCLRAMRPLLPFLAQGHLRGKLFFPS